MPDDATLRMVARLTDEISQPLKQIQKSFADFKHTADPEGTTTKFKGLTGAVKQFGSSITDFAKPALAGFGIASGVGAASVLGLTKVVTDYAKSVVDLKDTASILNISAGSVISWDRSLKAVGIEGGANVFKGIANDMLEMADNVEGVKAKWSGAQLGGLFKDLFPLAQAGKTEEYIQRMMRHLRELQAYNPARAAIFARDFMHIEGVPVPEILAGNERRQAAGAMDPEEARKRFEQAEKLKATMADFWETWNRFQTSALSKLVPGIDTMVKGMTAAFDHMPEAWDKFLGSPAGKLLAKMLETAAPVVPEAGAEGSKFDKEGRPRPPPELPPELADAAAEREAQRKRNAAGGALPSLFRAGAELGDLLTTGTVKRRTETSPVFLNVNKALERAITPPAGEEPQVKPPPTPLIGTSGRPYSSLIGDKPPASWSTTDPERPYASVIGDKPPYAMPAIPVPPPPPSVPLPAVPPATGDDVKEGSQTGSKQGIIEGLNAYAQSQALAQGLNFTNPTADVKRSVGDMQKAAASLAEPTDKKPVERIVDSAVKPGLEQDTKTSDLARRVGQDASDVKLNLEPSEAMKRLQAQSENPLRLKEDDTIKRLLQQPQLMPTIDPLALTTKVEGSATLKVDIAAPAGTKTDLAADGLFRQTEVSRRRAHQMEKTAFNDGFE